VPARRRARAGRADSQGRRRCASGSKATMVMPVPIGEPAPVPTSLPTDPPDADAGTTGTEPDATPSQGRRGRDGPPGPAQSGRRPRSSHPRRPPPPAGPGRSTPPARFGGQARLPGSSAGPSRKAKARSRRLAGSGGVDEGSGGDRLRRRPGPTCGARHSRTDRSGPARAGPASRARGPQRRRQRSYRRAGASRCSRRCPHPWTY